MTITHPSQLPSVDRILQQQQFTELEEHFGRDLVIAKVRTHLDDIRKTLIADAKTPGQKSNGSAEGDKAITIDGLYQRIADSLAVEFTPSLKKVFNLSGTVLHTNLGRAPYPQTAIDAMVEVSSSACNLEFDLSSGKRGRRDDHVEEWICKLTGAEAATTVNNNAAAVLLTLNSIAFGKKVIVSRGELIEIGGSFRIPAIMKKAGCKLQEVGTTNRSHVKDYEEAIGKKTAALMKVHTSNYEINGFTKSVQVTDLTGIASAKKIPLIDDLGSGTLTDMTRFGLPYERTARDAINEGADVITFSGDKLLGGPQCGIIAGRKDLIKLIDKNPMKRAMRLDKVTLAALEAVLRLYSNPDKLSESVPTLQLLALKVEQINTAALALQSTLSKLLPKFDVTISDSKSQIGSGALPTDTLASKAVVVHKNDHTSADTLARQFRSLSTPIAGRITQDALWLDCRVLSADLKQLIAMCEKELPAVLRAV